MQKFKRIGVLTSGGDAPGMNAAIRAITCKAIRQGVEVMGIIGGYSGLINENLTPLTTTSVANIISRGGTALYSNRCPEFKTEEGIQKAVATCKKYNIDAIIAIGGDGTFRGATDLSLHGIPTIGVTGTIDNDITATDYTVGFDTAMNTVVNMADQFRDTCQSHARCNVIEVMGRDCGWIALMAGVASGAVAVAIPEIPFDEARAIEKIKRQKSEGNRGMLVIVSEGVFEMVDGKKVPYGEILRKRIQEATGIETKFARLAHVVRGGSPTLRNRFTASKMGVRAVDLLLEGKSDLIVAEEYGKLIPTDIHFALTVDRMYKNKLQDGDLDNFSPEDIEKMKDICAKRTAKMERYYNLVDQLG
jgi:6-phosphofructokinase 1